MSSERHRGLATRAVHGGEDRSERADRPTSTPIYSTTSFVAPTAGDIDAILGGEKSGYVYSRNGNPTVTAFERAMAEVEGTESATAFSSGMAAIHAALLAAGVKSGSRVVVSRDCYGGTRSILRRLAADFGVSVSYVDTGDLPAVTESLRAPADALVVETISNPMLKVADVPALAEAAHLAGARLIVDATFSTPFLSAPAADGADIVMHSATKYLAGHGDVTAGVVCASAALGAALHQIAAELGAILGPQEAWLCLRGLKTLPLRLERQCSNAAIIAHFLSRSPAVERVHYPGLPNHPDHRLALNTFGGRFGAIISMELRTEIASGVLAFMDRLDLIQPAPTLGDVASLVSYSAQSSHRGLSRDERYALGITDSLVRLSVGIEDMNDLIADLEQALAPLKPH